MHEVGELVCGVAGRRRSLACPFVQEFQHEFAERFGNIVGEYFQLEFHLEDVFAGFFEVLAAEKVFADEHFACDDAYAKEVAGVIDFFAHDLFRAHVGGGADDATGLREFLADFEWRFGVGDTEVEEPQTSVLVYHHVRGLEVAVGDSVAVGVAKRT